MVDIIHCIINDKLIMLKFCLQCLCFFVTIVTVFLQNFIVNKYIFHQTLIVCN